MFPACFPIIDRTLANFVINWRNHGIPNMATEVDESEHDEYMASGGKQPDKLVTIKWWLNFWTKMAIFILSLLCILVKKTHTFIDSCYH
jgi:hypothetical protein